MTTSGTYATLNVPVEVLIREALERIGLPGELVEYQKLDAALRSLNFLLQEWMTREINLWTLKSTLIPLVTSQGQYTLPAELKDITQCSLRLSFRKRGGIAASNKPTAEDAGADKAFDGNPHTACTQTEANGTISYDFGAGNTQKITLAGIQSNISTSYTLILEGTDPQGRVVPLLTLPKQTYSVNAQGQGLIQWLELPNPGLYQIYSVRETGGATLNLQEIYWNNTVQDTLMSEVSRDAYLSTPLKNQTGRPVVYYLDRQIVPRLFIWPAPSSLYTCLFVSYEQMMQDVGTVANTLDIPARFYEPLIWGLAASLAAKYAPDKIEMARAFSDGAFQRATRDDTENTPFSIRGDGSGRS